MKARFSRWQDLGLGYFDCTLIKSKVEIGFQVRGGITYHQKTKVCIKEKKNGLLFFNAEMFLCFFWFPVSDGAPCNWTSLGFSSPNVESKVEKTQSIYLILDNQRVSDTNPGLSLLSCCAETV